MEGRASRKPGGFAVDDLLRSQRRYLHIVDFSHALFALAVAVTSWADGEPCWGMLVGAPGSGKTETVRLLDGSASARVGEITAAGLISWSRGRTPRPVGLLAEAGDGRVLATISDFSAILASNDRSSETGAIHLYALLRDAYDGRVTRRLGNAEPLEWVGRLTLVGAATNAIDRTSSHANALGPRWLSMRLPAATPEERRRIARAARRRPRELDEMRKEASQIATRLVRAAVEKLPSISLSESFELLLDDLAIATSLGRTAIERDPGTREGGFPSTESPSRVVGQLHQLARALVALDVPELDAARICQRVAMDSVPPERSAVLGALSAEPELSVADLVRRTGLHRVVVSKAVGDLDIIGVVRYRGRPEAGSHKAWMLDGEEAGLIRRAFEPPSNATKCEIAQSPLTLRTAPTSSGDETRAHRSSHLENPRPAPDQTPGNRPNFNRIWRLIDDFLDGAGEALDAAVIDVIAAQLAGGRKREREALVRRALNAGVKAHRYVLEKRGEERFVYRQAQMPISELSE